MENTSAAASTSGQTKGKSKRVRALVAHPATGRVLAGVGAALFAIAAWLPWWTLIGYLGPDASGPGVAYNFDPGRDTALPVLHTFVDASQVLPVWSAITVLGVALAPLLWQRFGSLSLRLAGAAYVLWLILANVVVAILIISVARNGLPIQDLVVPGKAPLSVPAQSYSLGAGVVLALAALLLSWVGVLLLARAELSQTGGLVTPAARYAEAQRLWRGTGWLTAGVIFWALGCYVTPWASYGCNGLPLFLGVCHGISESTALQAGIQSASSSYDPLAAWYAGPLLLAGGGILLLTGLSLRVSAGAFRVWGWLWALAALAVAVVAYSGVAAVIANPASFSLPSANWSGAPGLLATFLAVLFAVVGLVLLEFSARRAKPRAS
jgi:hypothetical protein